MTRTMARKAHGGAEHVRPRPHASTRRLPAIDALRGLAISAMVAYHFAFDLRYYGVLHQDFERDLFWLSARALILSSFLLLVGISLVLADRAGVRWRRHLKRAAVIALCAVAVTVASYIVFPARFIYFGTLHCIAVAYVLGWPLRRHPWLALGLSALIIVAGLVWTHPAFDSRATSWLGFVTHKPATEDFVPLFPWGGVVLVGIACAHVLDRRDFRPVAWLARLPRWLRWLGAQSLAVYMVHQPILLAGLWVAVGSW